MSAECMDDILPTRSEPVDIDDLLPYGGELGELRHQSHVATVKGWLTELTGTAITVSSVGYIDHMEHWKGSGLVKAIEAAPVPSLVCVTGIALVLYAGRQIRRDKEVKSEIAALRSGI